MRSLRFEGTAALERGRAEGVLSGGALQLVALRLTDAGPVADADGCEHVLPDVETLLRAEEARRLAFELLVSAEHADRMDCGRAQ